VHEFGLCDGVLDAVRDLLATRPRCAGADVQISGGDEMTLESIRYVAAPTPMRRPG
jgi:Zn finger protein HypA/HybF involved in hydrogenase expression